MRSAHQSFASAVLGVAASLALASPSSAACSDALATASTVKVMTASDDGERSTTVWVTCVDGDVFIRTSSKSKWGTRVERNPRLNLVVGTSRLEFDAKFVSTEPERARVTEAFREKYGLGDVMATWIRGRDPRIMRLEAISRD